MNQYSQLDPTVIDATHVAAGGDFASGIHGALDHCDAATAAGCFKNYSPRSPLNIVSKIHTKYIVRVL
jgi:hypothetical protein